MVEAQEIYFDESGFTGNDLLNDDQPVFVYASVAIKPQQATDLVAEMISFFRLQGNELKGSNLVSHRRSQSAVLWLIERCKGIASIVIANKKLALAGKFYEYIFEPVLQADNSLFYSVRLHRFLSNFLYISFVAKDPTAEALLIEFQTLMRNQDTSSIQRLFPAQGQLIAVEDPLSQILTFILCHKEKIAREIKDLGDIDGVRKWILELSSTCLFWTLSFWSEQFEVLKVYCDDSKPVIDSPAVFEAMIARQDTIYIKFGSDHERRLTFNLNDPITFLDSKKSHGIQIADVLSCSIAYAFNHPEEPFSKQCIDLAQTMLSPLCILPDHNEIDLNQKHAFINAMILTELVSRSVKKESLLDGMREYIQKLYIYYELFPPKLERK
ncbi:DUF3800 domain-containing protein [Dehalococcoides mccartyi]|uniref:DUF3800 domain-containing protein n=1 Tax=Dehalococcoides mccartyi TaxID=61435 RepID=UPI002FCA458D